MATESSIARRTSDPDGLDFDGLRKTGIELVQALCGDSWTDYNLHDPGVTLLEMLCYGLTDLLYRSELGVADLFTREHGGIDYHQQALFLPQEVLPCAPCTLLDWRKLLYDQLPQIDDIWLRMVDDPHLPKGLLEVYVKAHDATASDPVGADDQAHLLRQVRDLMAAQRNFGEDLHQVKVVQTQAYLLDGEIEIDDSRSSAAIYADIVFQCARQVSSVGRMMRYEEALASGLDREQLLTGPLTDHGFLDDREFARSQFRVDVVNLIGVIRKIPGVVTVRRLHLLDAAQNMVDFLECDPAKNHFPVLPFPATVEHMQRLRLVYRHAPDSHPGGNHQAARRMALPQDLAQLEQVQLALKKLDFEHQAYRRNHGHLDRLLEMPSGKYYPLHEYFSVSQHAPPIYGINRFGIPATEPPEVHARARQLKAYLYPFEQLMANFLQSLHALPELYSLQPQLRQSYFSQFLGDAQVSGLEALYVQSGPANPANLLPWPQRIQQVVAQIDPWLERRNRVLDCLLALYGETFPSESLLRFNRYRSQDAAQWLIECKIAWLNQLCQLSMRRGAGVEIGPQQEPVSPLQRKLMLLTGCDSRNLVRSLLAHLNRPGQTFVSGQRYRDALPVLDTTGARSLPSDPVIANAETLAMPYRMLCSELLQAGCDPLNYRMLPVADGRAWLCLQVPAQAQPWPLLLLPAASVAGSAHRLAAQLCELSQQGEGMYLIEHILLRPRSKGHQRTHDHAYYSCRATLVLPGFGARFGDAAFRLWLEELVVQQFPAHILVQIIWLDYIPLTVFESLHGKWLESLRRWHRADPDTANPVDAAEQLDQATERLISLLEKHRAADGERWL